MLGASANEGTVFAGSRDRGQQQRKIFNVGILFINESKLRKVLFSRRINLNNSCSFDKPIVSPCAEIRAAFCFLVQVPSMRREPVRRKMMRCW